MQTSANENSKTPPPKSRLKKSRKIFKFRFVSETSLHNVRRDQIYFYILSLHRKIRSLLRKCKRYKEKIFKLVSTIDMPQSFGYETMLIIICVCFKENVARKSLSTPEKSSTDDKSDVVQSNDTEPSTNNFIADIKNAAHQAQNEMGFIYEPTSGLYYDSRTGYYYNAVSEMKSQNSKPIS